MTLAAGLSIVGRAVGSYFGGPIGGVIGSLAGAAIGGALDRPGKQRQDAPPLVDLKVVGTEYGQPIPWVRGAVRLAGQLWWNTDRRPIYTTTRSGGGGKGGGPPETESTSVTYEMDALYGLTTDNGKPLAGDKIVGIARIWDNGKLIWTTSSASPTSSVSVSGTTTRWTRLTIYKGAADQLPDPTYEAAMLAEGRKPTAYRHRSSVFIEGLQLGSSGTIPNLTFDVIVDGGPGANPDEFFKDSDDPGTTNADAFQTDGWLYYDEATNVIWYNTGRANGLEDTAETREGLVAFEVETETWPSEQPVMPIGKSVLSAHFSGDNAQFMRSGFFNPESRTVLVSASSPVGHLPTSYPGTDVLSFDADTSELLGSFMQDVPSIFDPSRAATTTLQVIAFSQDYTQALIRTDGLGSFADHRLLLCAMGGDGLPTAVSVEHDHGDKFASDLGGPTIGQVLNQCSYSRFRMCQETDGGYWFMINNTLVGSGYGFGFVKIFNLAGDFDIEHVAAGADGVYLTDESYSGFEYDANRNCFYYFSSNHQWVKRLNCDDGTVERVNTVALSLTSSTVMAFDAEVDRIYLIEQSNTNSSVILTTMSPSDGSFDEVSVTYSGFVSGDGAFHMQTHMAIFANGTIWGRATRTFDSPNPLGTRLYGIGRLVLNIEVDCPTVATVQAAICERCGLTSSQYDVTDLASISRTVCSFPWSQVSPGREPSALLMSCFYYEITVSDKLYFRTRGGAPVATIEYDELAAAAQGDALPEPLPLRLAADIELPARKALTYANITNDYQNDTQLSDRLISAVDDSVEALTMSIGLEPDEAKAIVNTMLRDQAIALTTAQISVLGHHAAIEPTDVVTVMGPNGESYRMRAVTKRDAFPVIGLSLVLDDASVLADTGITDLDYESSTTVNGPVRTVLELLDIPLLRDVDDDPGIYAATKGTGTPYSGSAVYKSNNDVDYERVATITEPALIGETTSALADWTGPRILDVLSRLVVNFGRGTPVSSTRDLVLDSSANAFLVGSEIVQVIDWELISTAANGDKTYAGRRMLRGCRGTEWAMTGHAATERVVGLQTIGLRRVTLENTDIGVARYFKGVTLGRPISSADSDVFTNSAVGLKPFAPVDLRASRDVAGNVTLTAQRRSRLSVRMIGAAGINVPLAEDSESYEWDIYQPSSPNTVVRTLTSSTPSVTYTAAQQLADGLALFDPIDAGVFQISATIDRGYELRDTV